MWRVPWVSGDITGFWGLRGLGLRVSGVTEGHRKRYTIEGLEFRTVLM